MQSSLLVEYIAFEGSISEERPNRFEMGRPEAPFRSQAC